MADRLIGPIKFSGEFGKIPKVIFSYLLVNSVDGRTEKTREEGSGDHLIFPDCVDDLTEDERVDLYYYIREWFVNRDVNILDGVTHTEKKEYSGEKETLDSVLKGVLVEDAAVVKG